ncbi:MAG: tetratricopeptide repeat protein [Terriglobia bacterium]
MKKLGGLLFALLCTCGLYASPRTLTVVVFPFENGSASSDVGWISEAFAEVLSVRLSGPHRLVLDREERNAAYEQLGIPPNSILTLASEYDAAQTLGVDWAIVGSFTVSGQQLKARAQLLDLPHLKLYPAIEESGALSDLITIQTRLAWRLVAAHDPNFASISEEGFTRRFPVRRPAALENYVRGLLATDGAARVHFLTVADRLDSSDHRAAYALGRYEFEKKNYADSARWLSKLDVRDKDYLASLFLSGVDDFFLGRDKTAEMDFSALAGRMPLAEVWNNLGVLQLRQADYNGAVASFDLAYKSDPTDPDYSFNLAACYCDLHRYQQAVPCLRTAIENAPDDLGIRTLLAFALSKVGDTPESQSQLKWVAVHDGKTMANLNASILPQPRLKKNYNGPAFRLLAVAVRNSLESELAGQPPEVQARVHLMRGERLIRQKQLPEAVRELREAAGLLPDSAVVHLFLGQAYELQGEHQKALVQFRVALKYDENALTHLWMAHAYFSLHQTSEALEQSEAALRLDPGNAGAQRLISSIGSQAKSSRTGP